MTLLYSEAGLPPAASGLRLVTASEGALKRRDLAGLWSRAIKMPGPPLARSLEVLERVILYLFWK